jgi:hypothetical protein
VRNQQPGCSGTPAGTAQTSESSRSRGAGYPNGVRVQPGGLVATGVHVLQVEGELAEDGDPMKRVVDFYSAIAG